VAHDNSNIIALRQTQLNAAIRQLNNLLLTIQQERGNVIDDNEEDINRTVNQNNIRRVQEFKEQLDTHISLIRNNIGYIKPAMVQDNQNILNNQMRQQILGR